MCASMGTVLLLSPHPTHSQVVSDGNVLLGDDEIDKLVVLRMNWEFMKIRAPVLR